MRTISIDRRISQLNCRPCRVRPAVARAVSTTNVAFTATQARAENQFDARNRLQASDDRPPLQPPGACPVTRDALRSVA